MSHSMTLPEILARLERMEQELREFADERATTLLRAIAAGFVGLHTGQQAGHAALDALALSEARKALKGQGWQPIETAPKDGTRVFVYGWQYGVSLLGVGYWFQSRTIKELGGWICHTLPEQVVSGTFTDPTHWMPLPAPPTEEP